MSTDPVFSDLQKVNPSAIIELFTLALDTNLHGVNTVYRFHAGSNLPKQLSMNWVNSYDSASAFFTGSYRYFNGWNTYSNSTYNYVKGINIVVNQDNIKAGGILKIYGVEI